MKKGKRKKELKAVERKNAGERDRATKKKCKEVVMIGENE